MQLANIRLDMITSSKKISKGKAVVQAYILSIYIMKDFPNYFIEMCKLTLNSYTSSKREKKIHIILFKFLLNTFTSLNNPKDYLTVKTFVQRIYIIKNPKKLHNTVQSFVEPIYIIKDPKKLHITVSTFVEPIYIIKDKKIKKIHI